MATFSTYNTTTGRWGQTPELPSDQTLHRVSIEDEGTASWLRDYGLTSDPAMGIVMFLGFVGADYDTVGLCRDMGEALTILRELPAADNLQAVYYHDHTAYDLYRQGAWRTVEEEERRQEALRQQRARQEARQTQRARELRDIQREVYALSDHDLRRRYGHLCMNWTASRIGGNCGPGTREFMDDIARYGGLQRQHNATVAEVLDAWQRAIARQAPGYAGVSDRHYLNNAIAGTIYMARHYPHTQGRTPQPQSEPAPLFTAAWDTLHPGDPSEPGHPDNPRSDYDTLPDNVGRIADYQAATDPQRVRRRIGFSSARQGSQHAGWVRYDDGLELAVSYRTIIGIRDAQGWAFTAQRFSPTTGRHQRTMKPTNHEPIVPAAFHQRLGALGLSGERDAAPVGF